MKHPEVPEFIESLFETSQVPLTLTCPRLPDDPVIRANDAFLGMTGYSADDVIGRNCRFMQGADTDQPARTKIKKGLASRNDIQVMLRNYKKSGEPFDNFLFIFAITGGDGETLFSMGSQFEVPEVSGSTKLVEHAEVLKETLAEYNKFLEEKKRNLVHYNNLISMSLKSLVLTRLSTYAFNANPGSI